MQGLESSPSLHAYLSSSLPCPRLQTIGKESRRSQKTNCAKQKVTVGITVAILVRPSADEDVVGDRKGNENRKRNYKSPEAGQIERTNNREHQAGLDGYDNTKLQHPTDRVWMFRAVGDFSGIETAEDCMDQSIPP